MKMFLLFFSIYLLGFLMGRYVCGDMIKRKVVENLRLSHERYVNSGDMDKLLAAQHIFRVIEWIRKDFK